MLRFIQIFILSMIGLTCGGCADNTLNELAQKDSAVDIKAQGDLEFTYQVTDMEGNPSSAFKEGDNFIFSFVVKNQGEGGGSIGPWTFPIDEDFFTIYKKINEGSGKQRIGKSFRIGGNTKDGGHQSVPGKGEIEYRIPWLTQSDTSYIMPEYRPETNVGNRYYRAINPLPKPLSAGEYSSGFVLEFKETEIQFAISFKVD